MLVTRFTPLLFLSLVANPAHHTPTLTISVTADPVSPSAPLRIIASAGTVVAAGRSYRASSDTLRVTGSAELTTQDPIVVATFIADASGGRLRATVREDGVETLSGRADLILVVRTPQGAQLQAMPTPWSCGASHSPRSA
jgi:hypothetical protein